MVVHDALYGRFVLPSYVSRLVLTPEVRRLSQVRLLNSLTPSLSALGEVRRYSHTLGVLHLTQHIDFWGYSDEEKRALAAAVLAHDIGTPPFGHLMEYHLMESVGWNHEAAINDILFGIHAPENRAHQIFGGRSIEFRTALRDLGISVDLVADIVQKRHPLSLFLFGTLDLDNLDNVVRMSTFLGLGNSSKLAVQIARRLGVSRSRELLLDTSYRELVQHWSALRRAVYETMLFDPHTAASQAVLWAAIQTGFARGFLSAEDTFLTDEGLLDCLREHAETKDAIVCEYLGRPPEMVLCLQLKGCLADFGLQNRSDGQKIVEEVLKTVGDTERVLGYLQIDSGTLEKRLSFVSRSAEIWSLGSRSESVIFYGFVHRRLTESQSRKAAALLLEKLGTSKDVVLRDEITRKTQDAQPAFDFTPA